MLRCLGFLVFAAGCSTSTLVLSDRSASSLSRLTDAAASGDVREVRGLVTDISLPLLRSPSIAGDKATLTARVPAGAIPGHPELSVVALKYDCDNLMNAAKEGSSITFLFLPDGRFYGVKEWLGVEPREPVVDHIDHFVPPATHPIK